MLFYIQITKWKMKDTKTKPGNCLPYNIAHPKHCKDNFPYNLPKLIIVFVSNDEKVEMRLSELQNWLKTCNYPVHITN